MELVCHIKTWNWWLEVIFDHEMLWAIRRTCESCWVSIITWGLSCWYWLLIMNKKFNIRSSLLKCSACEMVTKCGMFAYQQLSDSGFGLVLLILLRLLSGIEISCWMDPKLVAWSWKDIQGTILHQFKSWSCMLLDHSERSHGLLPCGRRPSPGSKKVLCMQKQKGLSWVQLCKSFQERTLKVVFWILHSLECHSWKTLELGWSSKSPKIFMN